MLKASPPLAQAVTAVGPVLILANVVLLLQLFLVYSRLSEQVAFYLGGSTYIVRVLAFLTLAFTLATGGLRRVISSRVFILLTAFGFWLALAVPFSVWKGGSFELLREHWVKAYAFYIAVAGLLVTAAQCRRALYWIGFGAILTGILSLFIGFQGERLQLGAVGSLANPNDIAFLFVVSIPCCLLMVMNGRRSVLLVIGATGMLFLALLAFRTGSRSALLALVALFLLLLMKGSVRVRILVVAGALALGATAIILSPAAVLERYRTLFASPDQGDRFLSEEESKAVGSTEHRRNLLIVSLQYTVQHPLFGVGPGMFGTAVAGDQDPNKLIHGWLQTHNTYTQLSSEAGVPALLFFAAALFLCMRAMVRTLRKLRGEPELAQLSNAAYCVFLSLCMFAVSGLFMGLGYSYYFPTLAGIADAIERAAGTEMRRLQAAGSARAS